MNETYSARLDRIEDGFARIEKKIDDLNKAFVDIARVEERYVSMQAQIKMIIDDQRRIASQIVTLERAVDENSRVTGGIKKFVYGVSIAVASTVLGHWLLLHWQGLLL